jgi:elongation factor Ts
MTNLEKIKQLREETGLSMAQIKASVESTETLEEARTQLNALRVEDTHDKVAKKGMVRVVSKGNDAILYEINALTDFVNKHEAFIQFVEDFGKLIIQYPNITIEEAMNLQINHQSVEDYRLKVETLIAEKVVVSRISTIKKEDHQSFGMYVHSNYSSAAVVILDQDTMSPSDANKIAMQVTALGKLYPKWKQTVIDQILASELLGQPIAVKDFLNQKDVKLLHATRYELGESMNEHLSCSLVADTFCQTTVKEVL